jgi:hypothetical protein
MTRVGVVGGTVAISWAAAFVVVAIVEANQYTSAMWLLQPTLWFVLLRNSALDAFAITILPALIGGIVAYRTLVRQRTMASRRAWMSRSVGFGVLLGGFCTLSIPLGMALVDTGTSWFLFARTALFGATGAIAGGLAGCGVGEWCYRQQQQFATQPRSSGRTAE